MRLFCVHLTDAVIAALRAIAEPHGSVVTPCDGFADLPAEILRNDRLAVPIGDVLPLVAALRERSAPLGIDILAITSPGIAANSTSTSEAGIDMTFISEDELLRLSVA